MLFLVEIEKSGSPWDNPRNRKNIQERSHPRKKTLKRGESQ